MDNILPILQRRKDFVNPMYDFERMDKRLIVFVDIFLLSNRLQTTMDAQLADLTAKQWLALIMLGMFEQPPTLKELAKVCGASHQNTKQIILKLQAKGYVDIEKDSKDGRTLRISATAKFDEFGQKYQNLSERFIDKMFSVLTQEEIIVLSGAQKKLQKKLEEMHSET